MKFNNYINDLKSWIKEHSKALCGIGAITFGVLLIMHLKGLLLNLAVLLLSLTLIYYGLYLIEAKQITDFIDKHMRFLKDRYLR